MNPFIFGTHKSPSPASDSHILLSTLSQARRLLSVMPSLSGIAVPCRRLHISNDGELVHLILRKEIAVDAESL